MPGHTIGPSGSTPFIREGPAHRLRADDETFTKSLARRNVFVFPGTLFETPGFFRMSLTANEDMTERILPTFESSDQGRQERNMDGRTYPPGVPCWIDTTQPAIDAAATFYAGLFGWTFREAAPGDGTDRYLVAQLDSADVAGIASGREDITAWSTYIAVEDADAAVDRLVGAGAGLRARATDAGEDGRSAALTDPEGVEFRLWQPKRQGGAQAVNQPGTWNFSDLHTRNPEAAVGFYQGAFGWQVDKVGFGADDADFGLMVRMPGYGDHLEATVDPEIRVRQSGFAAPPGFADAVAWIVPIGAERTPHWHVTFAVADRDRTALDAERLGAQVLRQDDTGWTREALIRDPQGAVFTASQFTPPTG